MGTVDPSGPTCPFEVSHSPTCWLPNRDNPKPPAKGLSGDVPPQH